MYDCKVTLITARERSENWEWGASDTTSVRASLVCRTSRRESSVDDGASDGGLVVGNRLRCREDRRMSKPWRGEFPIENPKNLDVAAREMIVENINAGQTRAREIVVARVEDGYPVYRYADDVRAGVPDNLCMRPGYLDIEAWKCAKAAR